VYERDWVSLLLGEAFHPGGMGLTRRLADTLGLRRGMKVLDVASGRGATALLLADRYGVEVAGVDRSPTLVASAARRAAEDGLAEQARFVVGDGEELPFATRCFDAVVCECALCTFPTKGAATAEMARVLRPGGRVGITDVTVQRASLDDTLMTLAGWVGCLAGACSSDGYADLLRGAGLRVLETRDCSGALTELLARVEPRLMALAALRLPAVPALDAGEVRRWMAVARQAVATGVAGYSLLAAEKPAAPAA
jgi:hypothetical protein